MPDTQRDRLEKLMKEACEFQGNSLASRQKASDDYKRAESDGAFSVRFTLDGLMARLANNMEETVSETNESISYQIALSASYVRTHYLVNDLILNGDLVEAVTLIRKQIESLARLHELDSKPLSKLDRKTPNVQNILKNAGKSAYPVLSEVAHFSSPKVAELLHAVQDEERHGPSMIPKYSENAHGCFDLQAFVSLYFLFWFLNKQKDFYPEKDLEEEEQIFFSALQAAREEGIVRVDES